MNDPKPIETAYAGHLFRSRLEAKWAVFFNAMSLKWEYEPQGFAVGKPARPYLPDFYLADQGLWVEIKPSSVDLADPAGLHLWEDFAGEVSTEWNKDKAAMFIGPPPDPELVDEQGPPRADRWYDDGIIIVGDYQYAWCACPSGEHFDIQFRAHGGRIHCGCPRVSDDRYRTGNNYRILGAYRAARMARFDRGQRPAA